jgi:hypothetical protein
MPRPAHALPLALGFALVLATQTACVSGDAAHARWPAVQEVAHSAGAKLGGVAIGDVLPEHAGQEIVAVAVDGRVIVIQRESERWNATVAFDAPGELIAVACGELIAERAGEEILAVGMAQGDEDAGGAGAVWLIARTASGGFEARELLRPSALQHAAAIGDFDPERPGLEALSAGFDRRAHLFHVAPDLSARAHEWAELPGPAKGACVWKDRAILACASGHVLALAREPQLAPETLMKRAAGFARPAVHGDLLVAASDDGSLVARDLVQRGPQRLLHRQGMKARGAYVGELDSSSPGIEAATVGYEGRVLLLRLGASAAEDEPELIELAATGVALHHLAGGDVRPDRPGDELVTVGFAGEVLVLSR